MRFWRYLITACQSEQGQLGQSVLALLATTLQPPYDPLPHEMLLSPFLNDLPARRGRRRPGAGRLPCDHEPQIHEALTFFLDHLPATLHVVILTRSEPPLPLRACVQAATWASCMRQICAFRWRKRSAFCTRH